MKWIKTALPGLVATIAVGHFVAASSFRKKYERLVVALRQSPAEKVGASEPPPIVRAFAQRAGVARNASAAIRLRQRFEMRFDPGDAWTSGKGRQVIAVHRPGFVWLGAGRLGSPFPTRVIDSYVKGRGLLEARLLGSVPVARFDGPETEKGELMRYLAELPWAPDAMLHNSSLRWRELDDELVEVCADGAGGSACVRLIFENGDVVRTEADDRPRSEGARFVPRRWQGRFWDYREIGGRRIPARGEAGWVIDNEYFAGWRGEIVDFAVEDDS